MTTRPRIGLLATHPIQYYAPWYRALAKHVDLEVFFSHKQTAGGQADAGFGVEFEWDVPLLEGYHSQFLTNTSRSPDVNRFFGCVTPQLPEIIRERSFAAFIVHGWGTASYWQAMRACWQTGTPLLVRGDSALSTPLATWRRAVKYPIYRWFIPRFDAYLVVGTRARRYLMHYGADPAKCFDAPHSVDNDRFAAAAAAAGSQSTVREAFGLPRDAMVLLFTGKFIALKRADLFVQAIARAASVAPRVVGLMVGDGPRRSSVERAAGQLNAPVRFTGFLNQQDVARAYAASDVLVVPSERETWCLAVNEAMACGVPAVVTDGVGCSDDLIIPGQTGEIFPVNDLNGLVERIVRMAHDPSRVQAMKQAARAHIAGFTIDAAVRGTLLAIQNVTQRSANREARPAAVAVRGTGR